jgi:hypothetical protein
LLNLNVAEKFMICQHNEAQQTLFEKGERGKNGNIMEGINLFQVYCMHIWNYYNEIPS